MRPFGLDNVLVEVRKVGVGHLRRVRTVVGEGVGARQLVLRGIKDSLGVIGGLLGGLLSGGSLAQSRLCLVELGLCPGDVRLRAQGEVPFAWSYACCAASTAVWASSAACWARSSSSRHFL